MENLALLIVGTVLTVLGTVNMTGNISTIHTYNRKRVKEEDIPRYGKAVGLGTLLVGMAFLLNFILILLQREAAAPFVLIPTIGIGLAIILYAQFRYNKGLF